MNCRGLWLTKLLRHSEKKLPIIKIQLCKLWLDCLNQISLMPSFSSVPRQRLAMGAGGIDGQGA